MSIVINNKIYVICLLFDVLFDLSVRQFVFLRLSSMEIIQYHPFGMSQCCGLLSQLLSLPLRSVRLHRSDALPPAQPVNACFMVNGKGNPGDYYVLYERS